MTKAFLPILKKQSISGSHKYSQIVNIISVAGVTSGTGLGASAYEASKHASEAFTNSLRVELKIFGIRVVALNPSFYDTPLTNNVEQRFRNDVLKRITPACKEEYGEGMVINNGLFDCFTTILCSTLIASIHCVYKTFRVYRELRTTC